MTEAELLLARRRVAPHQPSPLTQFRSRRIGWAQIGQQGAGQDMASVNSPEHDAVGEVRNADTDHDADDDQSDEE